MFRRWLRRVERGRKLRAAADLESWLASAEFVLENCATAQRSVAGETDVGQTLDRVDRELMRFRNHAADVRPQLRRAAPALAEPVRRATDDIFHLRNSTHTYLLRWQSSRLQTGEGRSLNPGARRELEEALLRASEAARRLRSDLVVLTPPIHELIDAWSKEG
jgi:hypothetical protein